jgi:hypothetical protein
MDKRYPENTPEFKEGYRSIQEFVVNSPSDVLNSK